MAPATLRALGRDPAALFGLAILVLLLVLAVGGPWLILHEPGAIGLRLRLRPPAWLEGGTWSYPLGTDHLGRDVFSRVVTGARVTLLVGLSVVALAGSVGVAVGLAAGYVGGRTDAILMRIVDTKVAFPGLLIALVILAVLRASVPALILVLSFNGWMVYARMARGVTLGIRQSPYIEAAEMIGARPARIVWRHVAPHLVAPMLTLAVLEFARVMLAEAALSFLGVGIQPPGITWGLDCAIGKAYIFRAWWLVTFPGLAIALSVLGVNLFANGLRLAADPRYRDRQAAVAVPGVA